MAASLNPEYFLRQADIDNEKAKIAEKIARLYKEIANILRASGATTLREAPEAVQRQADPIIDRIIGLEARFEEFE